MDKEDFVFKRSWLEYVAGLQPRVRLDVYEAIISYSLNGTVGSLGQVGRVAFMPIKKEIDAYTAWLEKRKNISDKRREAGRRGAMLKKNLLKQNQAKQNFASANDDFASANDDFASANDDFASANDDLRVKNASECSQKPQISSLKAQSLARAIEDNQDNIGYNKNIISKIKKENAEKKETEAPAASTSASASSSASTSTKAPASSSASTSTKAPAEIDVQRFIDYFNSVLTKAGCLIPHQCILTDRRKAAIAARAHEYGKTPLKTMVDKAAASAFLNGGNDRAWVANIDWLLRPNNFVKVVEGNYDNKTIESLKFNVQNSMFKVKSYGKIQQYDPRRGVAAGKHSADEY